jgi:hypothetical protein
MISGRAAPDLVKLNVKINQAIKMHDWLLKALDFRQIPEYR